MSQLHCSLYPKCCLFPARTQKSHHPVIGTHMPVNSIQVWTVVVLLLLIFAIHNIAAVCKIVMSNEIHNFVAVTLKK